MKNWRGVATWAAMLWPTVIVVAVFAGLAVVFFTTDYSSTDQLDFQKRVDVVVLSSNTACGRAPRKIDLHEGSWWKTDDPPWALVTCPDGTARVVRAP